MASKQTASYWNGSAWVDFTTSSNSDLINMSYSEALGTPTAIHLRISNPSSDPFANSGASSKGPYTGVITDFMPIKVRDSDSGHLIFYGAATDVNEIYDDTFGMVLDVNAEDYLFELRDNSTRGAYGYTIGPSDETLEAELAVSLNNSDTTFTVTDTSEMFITGFIKIESEIMKVTKINSATSVTVTRAQQSTSAASHDGSSTALAISEPTAPIYTTVENTGIKDVERKLWKQNISSRSGLIKSLINHMTENITHPGNAASTDARFTDSTLKYRENEIYELSGKGKKAALRHIGKAASEEPHASAANNSEDFGYDFYVDPNFSSTATSHKPTPFFNYFKKGTRPTTETAGPKVFGLSLQLPSPDLVTGGRFVETGRTKALYNTEIKRPKKDIYTDVAVQYAAVSKGAKGDGVASANEIVMEAIEIFEPTGQNSLGDFKWDGYDIDGGTAGTDSTEYLRTTMTQLNGAISSGDTQITVDSTTGMFPEMILAINFPGEHVKVLSVDSSTQITVERGFTGYGSSVSAGSRSDDSYVWVLNVAKIQYIANTSEAATVTEANACLALISHVDKGIAESSVVWQQGTGSNLDNTFYGETSQVRFQLKSRPRLTLGIRRTFNFATGSETAPNAIRENVAAALRRRTSSSAEGKLDTYNPPVYHIDNVPSAASGSGTQTITYGETSLLGTLSSDINDSVTTIPVTNTIGMYTGQTIKIGSEKITVGTVASKTSLTGCTRGASSTSAASHSSGAAITDASVDLRKYGLRPGMCVNILSSGVPSTSYGYVSSVSATQIVVTWSTGGVSTSSPTDSTLRYYIPVRVGDVIHVRDDLANIDAKAMVLNISYQEGSGSSLTSYQVVSAESAEEQGSPKKSLVSATAEATAQEEGLPPTPELASDANVTTSVVFSAPSASQVNWAAGNLYIGADVYAISAANTSQLETLNSDGRTYYVYYKKGEDRFRVKSESDFKNIIAKKRDSEIKVIAHVNYDLPLARFTLVGIKGGQKNSSIVSTSGNIDNVYGANGSNSAPTYSFANDTDLGMYSNGAGSIRFASAGYHAASIGASNATNGTIAVETFYTWIDDTDTYIYGGQTADQIGFYTGGGLRGRFYNSGLVLDQLGSGSGTALVHDGSNVVLSSTSSKKYKRNIVDIALDSSKVDKLRPVDFEWNEKSAMEGVKDIGLIAEEVHEIFPEIVNYKNNKPESVSYDKLSVILLMEIKKLKEEIEKLKENK